MKHKPHYSNSTDISNSLAGKQIQEIIVSFDAKEPARSSGQIYIDKSKLYLKKVVIKTDLVHHCRNFENCGGKSQDETIVFEAVR